VDEFFDKVMVMVDDVAVRDNRLALLNRLGNLFLNVADISRLQRLRITSLMNMGKSYQDMSCRSSMLASQFHDKHRFRETGGEELAYRVALMTEELGEISACVTKGKSKEHLAEECADLFILLLRHGASPPISDLRQAFWDK
jgi:hypothetical protein